MWKSPVFTIMVLVVFHHPSFGRDALVVCHHEFRKTSIYDPGTWRVWIRNTSNKGMKLRRVFFNGPPIPVIGVVDGEFDAEWIPPTIEGCFQSDEKMEMAVQNRSLSWAKFEPSLVPPGQWAELSIKPYHVANRPAIIEFIDSDGVRQRLWIPPNTSALTVKSITFSRGMDNVFIYVKNNTSHSLRLNGIDVDGEEIPRSRLSFSEVTVPPSQLGIIVWKPEKPLPEGTRYVFAIRGPDGYLACEQVRAIHYFVVGNENGRLPTAHGFSDISTPISEPVFSKDGTFTDNQPSHAPRRIISCPMHEWGRDFNSVAALMHQREATINRAYPSSVVFTHHCRNNPADSCAKFGELGDCISVNSNVEKHFETFKSLSPLWDGEGIVRHASKSVRPKGFFVLADTGVFGRKGRLSPPADFRRRAYVALGQGAKGLLYRHAGKWTGDTAEEKRLLDAIAALNAELAILRPYLAIACPSSDSTLATDTTRVYTLQAGLDSVVVVAVQDKKEEGAVAPPPRAVRIPAFGEVAEVRRVEGDNTRSIQWKTDGEGGVEFLDSFPDDAVAYIITRDSSKISGVSPLVVFDGETGGDPVYTHRPDMATDGLGGIDRLFRRYVESGHSIEEDYADLAERVSTFAKTVASREIKIEALELLGEIHRWLGRRNEFMADYDMIQSLLDDPSGAPLWFAASRKLKKEGDMAGSVQCLFRIVRSGHASESDRNQALFLLTAHMRDLEYWGVALFCLRKIGQGYMNGETARKVHRGIADIYLDTGRFNMAVAEYGKLAERYPEEREYVLFQLALLHQTGDYRKRVKAMKYYNALISDFPEGPYYETASQNLKQMRNRLRSEMLKTP